MEPAQLLAGGLGPAQLRTPGCDRSHRPVGPSRQPQARAHGRLSPRWAELSRSDRRRGRTVTVGSRTSRTIWALVGTAMLAAGYVVVAPSFRATPAAPLPWGLWVGSDSEYRGPEADTSRNPRDAFHRRDHLDGHEGQGTRSRGTRCSRPGPPRPCTHYLHRIAAETRTTVFRRSLVLQEATTGGILLRARAAVRRPECPERPGPPPVPRWDPRLRRGGDAARVTRQRTDPRALNRPPIRTMAHAKRPEGEIHSDQTLAARGTGGTAADERRTGRATGAGFPRGEGPGRSFAATTS